MRVRQDESEDETEFSARYHDTPIRVYRTLKDKARVKGWIGYEELNQACNLGIDLGTNHGRKTIGDFVGTVSEFEVSKHRPMLSAIVVRKQSPRKPGQGFYKLADELGLRKLGESDEELWRRTLNECLDYWSQRP